MAGLSKAITGDQVQINIGTHAKNVNQALKAAQDSVDFLKGMSNAELLSLYQIPAADADILRAAVDALEDLWGVYRGQDALPAPRDFKKELKPVIGFG